MQLEVGQIVKSQAGHDKGELFVAAGFIGKVVLLCNGKDRPLEKPKKKSLRHIEPTSMKIDECSMATNRKLRKTLNILADSGR